MPSTETEMSSTEVETGGTVAPESDESVTKSDEIQWLSEKTTEPVELTETVKEDATGGWSTKGTESLDSRWSSSTDEHVTTTPEIVHSTSGVNATVSSLAVRDQTTPLETTTAPAEDTTTDSTSSSTSTESRLTTSEHTTQAKTTSTVQTSTKFTETETTTYHHTTEVTSSAKLLPIEKTEDKKITTRTFSITDSLTTSHLSDAATSKTPSSTRGITSDLSKLDPTTAAASPIVGIAIGATVGVLVLILVIILAVYFIRIRRRKTHDFADHDLKDYRSLMKTKDKRGAEGMVSPSILLGLSNPPFAEGNGNGFPLSEYRTGLDRTPDSSQDDIAIKVNETFQKEIPEEGKEEDIEDRPMSVGYSVNTFRPSPNEKNSPADDKLKVTEKEEVEGQTVNETATD